MPHTAAIINNKAGDMSCRVSKMFVGEIL